MKRLYLQIYLTVLASLFAFAFVAGAAWRHLVASAPSAGLDIAAEVAQGALPPAPAPREAQQAALERLSAGGRVHATLFDAGGATLASVGAPLPPGARSGWRWRRGLVTLDLPDGRSLVARLPRERSPSRAIGFFATLGVIALAVAVGAYPAVRRLTRRLERLRSSVEALGSGDLAARVAVQGRDEVAALAASFNRAAERIEQLVAAHKALLANASHELRSPLARMRVGVEMLGEHAKPALRAELERNVAELDALVEEILLASRLDAVASLEVREPIDLLALAAEECARVDAALEGDPVTLNGDPRLARRMIRNLLENARRYGGETRIDVEVRRSADDTMLIRVCDRGPGVPEAERERIFEPFYRPAGTRERTGGVGLGLALVRAIARKHGGEVHCVAREGGGSCFEVTLSG